VLRSPPTPMGSEIAMQQEATTTDPIEPVLEAQIHTIISKQGVIR